MARTSKIWQVSSFQSLLPSPQLLLKPTLPLQRTLLCIVHYHEFTFNWWVMQLEVPNCGMRKPIHRMGFPPLQHQISHAFCLGGGHMTKAIRLQNFYNSGSVAEIQHWSLISHILIQATKKNCGWNWFKAQKRPPPVWVELQFLLERQVTALARIACDTWMARRSSCDSREISEISWRIMAMYSSRNCELPKGIKFDVETKNYLYHMLRIERATHLPDRGHVSPHKGRNPHWFIFWALYSTMSKTHMKAYKSVNMAQNHWIEFFSCKTKRKVNKQLGQTYSNYKKLRHISVQPLQFFWSIFRISFMYDVYTYIYIYIPI